MLSTPSVFSCSCRVGQVFAVSKHAGATVRLTLIESFVTVAFLTFCGCRSAWLRGQPAGGEAHPWFPAGCTALCLRAARLRVFLPEMEGCISLLSGVIIHTRINLIYYFITITEWMYNLCVEMHFQILCGTKYPFFWLHEEKRIIVNAKHRKCVLYSATRTACTHNVGKAEIPERQVMVRVRKHSFHFIRGQSRSVGVNEICWYYRAGRISVKEIEITHISKIIWLRFPLQHNRHSGAIYWATNHTCESA